VKPSAAILRKASAVLLDAAGGKPVDVGEARRIALLIAPRPRARKNVPRHPRPEREGKLTTKEIAVIVRERAGDLCEACRRPFTKLNPFSLDHWLNGTGRRIPKESVETCWGIHKFSCHPARQEYRFPLWATVIDLSLYATGLAFWNATFKAHCDRQGYPFEAHIEHQAVTRRGSHHG
jgi:hypothetical protein